MRSLFRFWRNPDDPDSGGGAAAAPAPIRRNGDRLRAEPRVVWRRPHWSAARAQTRLFTPFRAAACLAICATLAGVPALAQFAPTVTMRVTFADGHSEELTARESGLATVTLKDGTEYGFRPTIQDSRPWDRIVVTVFRMATSSSPAQAIGDVEVKRGGPAVDAKTAPAFKIAVSDVSLPATATTSTH